MDPHTYPYPCPLPSLALQDFVYLDSNGIDSTTPIQANIGNGVADITWGQGVDEPFAVCCGE